MSEHGDEYDEEYVERKRAAYELGMTDPYLTRLIETVPMPTDEQIEQIRKLLPLAPRKHRKETRA